MSVTVVQNLSKSAKMEVLTGCKKRKKPALRKNKKKKNAENSALGCYRREPFNPARTMKHAGVAAGHKAEKDLKKTEIKTSPTLMTHFKKN